MENEIHIYKISILIKNALVFSEKDFENQLEEIRAANSSIELHWEQDEAK